MLSLLSLLFAVSTASANPVARIVPRTIINDTISLSIPASPPEGRQVIPANFQGYSIEFGWFGDYGGNATNPNLFSRKMLQNLFDISGANPIIRVGGSTQNRAVFNASQEEGVILTISPSAPLQPSVVSIGPNWMQSFKNFPEGTKYIYGLSFNDGEAGLNLTVTEAANAWDAIGEDIFAFEIGNEVDGFPGTSHRPANWTVQVYVDQWNQYANAIDEQVFGSDAKGIEPIFDGCAFEAPRSVAPGNNTWNVATAIQDGMASEGHAKTVSDHDYMGAACAGSPSPTIEGNLLDHFRMTSLMVYHEALGNYSAAHNVTYTLGETNSISCQGFAGISDVFAASIWSVDYILYVAALPISRIYFHQGTGFAYSAWQAVEYNGTAAHVMPLYYGHLLTSTAFAGGDKQVEVLMNTTHLTAYGVYDAEDSSSGTGAKLDSVVIVNLNVFNSTMDASERPYTAVQLPSDRCDLSKAKVQRLTGPGVDVADNITFAGQSVDEGGNIVGTKIFEAVSNGTVLVGAGEAVLVTF